MDLTGIPTQVIDWTSNNLPLEWKNFKEHTELIFNGVLNSKDEPTKCTYLLLRVGQKGRDIHKSWNLSADDSKKLDTLYQGYEKHVEPESNSVFKRFLFNNIVQGSNSIEDFITQLRISANDCKFTNQEEMIRDRVVMGVTSSKIREKMLNEGEKLTLDKAIGIAQSYEYAQAQLRSMGEPTNQASVNEVQPRRRGQPAKKGRASHAKGDTVRQKKPAECDRCGSHHKQQDKCPAKGKQCLKCKKHNHFAVKCRTVTKRVGSRRR